MKRLLFVDDEPMVLEALRRALHAKRQEWEMRFVTSPSAAMEALDREPFDAIITDMRMPEMDGAQLLEYVKEHHSDMVRIVLSGQSKKETIMRSIVPAHQFLSKPCNFQELRDRLAEAFARRDLLRNKALAGVVSRLKSIPSLPSLYRELTAALKDENASLTAIEEIISKDVGMAAKILQLANSAFIGARGRVSSLHEAVSLIGAETVRSLTLSIHIFAQFDRHSSVAELLPAIWKHSVAVASLAQRIAMEETGNKALAEESFTTGLLHDVGKVVLLAEMSEEYRQVLARIGPNSHSTRELESEFLGCPHEQVGAYLMSIWGLPVSIMRAVEHHHCPLESKETAFSSLTALHCADAIVSQGDSLPILRDMQLDEAYLKMLGLSGRVAAWSAYYAEYGTALSERESAEEKNIAR